MGSICHSPELSSFDKLNAYTSIAQEFSQSWSGHLINPQQVIEDSLKSQLSFMGRVRLARFDSHSSCMFENDEIYIVYHYCSHDRRELHAQSFEILSKKGGKLKVYIDTYNKDLPPSIASRNEFKRFDIQLQQTAIPRQVNAYQLKSFLDTFDKKHSDAPFCYLGNSFDADTAKERTRCVRTQNSSNAKGDFDDIKDQMNQFWNNTPETLSDFMKMMRSKIETIRF